MRISGIAIGRSSTDELDRILAKAAGADVTYQDVGMTPRPESDAAPHTVDLGGGEQVFRAACAALRMWVPQRGIGARIHPADAPLEVGVTLLVVVPFGPFEMIAPNRIVGVIDELNRFGFAYGTLPGHPERGEESFVVERGDDQTVRLTISVDAAPSTWLGRLLSPLVARVQAAALRRYLAAVQRYVAESSG